MLTAIPEKSDKVGFRAMRAAERGVSAFVASADVEGAFDGIRHEDVKKALLPKGCSSWGSLLASARIL